MTTMLYSFQKLIGYRIQARDGLIGTIRDFYFDDRDGRIVCTVIDTRRWFSGRHVLIPAHLLGEPNIDNRTLPSGLTREELKNAPGWNTRKPVCREHEREFNNRTPPIFGSASGFGVMGIALIPAPMKGPEPVHPKEPELKLAENHLRSGAEVMRYALWSADGKLGDITDFVVALETWEIPYMLMEVLNNDPAHTIMVPMNSVTSIDWANQRVVTNLTKAMLRSNLYLRFGQKPKSSDRLNSLVYK